jgi:hypothetical protein
MSSKEVMYYVKLIQRSDIDQSESLRNKLNMAGMRCSEVDTRSPLSVQHSKMKAAIALYSRSGMIFKTPEEAAAAGMIGAKMLKFGMFAQGEHIKDVTATVFESGGGHKYELKVER